MSRCAFASLPSPLYRFLRISAIFLFFAGLALAQVQPGTPNWSAIETHAVDSINLSNLVVSLNIPVRSKAGAIPFNFGFINGSSYVANNAGALAAGYSTNPLAPAANGMLMTSTTFATYGYLLRVPATDCGGSTGYAYKTDRLVCGLCRRNTAPAASLRIFYIGTTLVALLTPPLLTQRQTVQEST
jgi:hypothetical protein